MHITELRKAAGLTKTQLAQAMDVDLAAVHRWETGEAMPRADKLPRLADLLGCSIDALYGRPDLSGSILSEKGA